MTAVAQGAEEIDLRGKPGAWPTALARRFAEDCAAAAADTPLEHGAKHVGDPELRQYLADVEGVPFDDLVITTGVRFAVRGLTAGRCCTLVESPTFSGVALSLRQLGAPFASHTWTSLPGAVHEGCAIWLTSPFRSPVGDTPSAADIGCLAATPDVAVVQNLTYAWAGDPVPKREDVAYVFSFHKLAGPGARLGWAAAPDAASRLAPELRGGSPPAVWQRAWLRFLRSGSAAELACWRRDMVARNRRAFLAALGPCADYALPGGGPNVALVHPGLGVVGVARLVRALEARNVLVSPGEDFGLPLGIRVCVDNLLEQDCARAAETISSCIQIEEGGIP
jgi:DNA-binding transcriptional MocR family regulator